MHIYHKRASLEGLEREIFKLVSYSATPEQWKEWLRVPLEHAAARGNLDLFNKLLGAGADGSAGWRGCRNRTLLDAAAVGGNEDVVSSLLRVGAQPDVKVVSTSSKRSALYTATMLGHESIARLLMVAGADVNFQDPIDKRPILLEAFRGEHAQLATELLIGGANPNCRDGDDGASPLHVAAVEGLDGIASTLLFKGADKNAVDHDGQTPLGWASCEGRLSIVKTLLAHGADASIRSKDNLSALDHAASFGHCCIIEAIAEHGEDVNARDCDGFTALHAAAQHDHADAVNALIKAGAEIEPQTYEMRSTPLASAASYSSCKAALALLRHGAKVDVEDDEGRTPLHQACSRCWKGVDAMVDLLLRWGADETALDGLGDSPAELVFDNMEYFRNATNLATPDEIERARLLLSRAPADRAWRRRGWLVMLRSRDDKARSTRSSDSDSGSGGGPCVQREGEGCKAAKTDAAGGGGIHVRLGADGESGDAKALSGVVALLTEVEPECVFRTIVGYL